MKHEQEEVTEKVTEMESKMEGLDPGLVALLKDNGMKTDQGYQWNNPLFWLIILGFLRGENGGFFGGGNGDGHDTATAAALAAQGAKLDCLAQGQQDAAMATHNTNMVNLAHSNTITQNEGFNRLAASLAECCCNLRSGQKDIVNELAKCCCTLAAGQKDIENALCLQTNTLVMNMTTNTQRIIDNTNAHANAVVAAELASCKAQLSNAEQTKELIAALKNDNSDHGRSVT